MRYWRWYILVTLLGGPVLVLVGFGMYHLWLSGWWVWLWWPLTGAMALAFYLAWRWQRQQRLLRVDFTPPLHWTERDRQAWKLVEQRGQKAPELSVDKLSSMPFYWETAQDMALEIARFYHPRARDAIASLTIYEILAVVELAAHDLARMVDQFLPGGHLLTLRDWRRARQAAEWYQTASNLRWLIAGIFNPVRTGLQYMATQAGFSLPWQKVQQNLFVWAYTAFVHRLGSYLIDLNSGRLRVGAERYRQLLAQQERSAADGKEPAEAVRQITVVILGQAKMGKSSLVNALLGEQRAQAHVVNPTSEITRYELSPAGIDTQLVLLDTVGYGHTGPHPDQRRATEQAARQADLLLLVVHARNPARQGDVDMLEDLRVFFQAQPELNPPPILAVMTHIDLLSPSLEWAPPYDWLKPRTPKEQNIAQALDAVREQMGSYVAGVVPVCTAPGKVFGIQEALLPAVSTLLDQAHAVALLRCLRAEADTGKVRKVFQQLLAAGMTGLQSWLQRDGTGKDPRAAGKG